MNIDLKGAKVVLQGFGNASTFSGEYLEKMGAKCIAASDSKGSILVPDGFKVQDLIDYKQKEGSVVGIQVAKKFLQRNYLPLTVRSWFQVHLKTKSLLILQRN